jgi:hypothetical protein
MSTEPWRGLSLEINPPEFVSVICSDGVMRTERYLPGRGRRGSAGATTDPVARYCQLLAGIVETMAAIMPTNDENAPRSHRVPVNQRRPVLGTSAVS